MTCPWMFHGVSRRENGDGTTTLTLTGWRYTSNAERDPGGHSTCRWCRQPVHRTEGRTWRAAYGDDCPDAGPAGFGIHSPETLPQVAHAPAPCVERTVPVRSIDVNGVPYPVVESAEAAELVREHVGAHYTVCWQGRGWTVELEAGYPLWRVTC